MFRLKTTGCIAAIMVDGVHCRDHSRRGDPRVVLFAQYLWKDEPAGDGRKYTGWQSGMHFADGTPKPALDHFGDPIWVDFRDNVAWGQVRPARRTP